MDDLSASDTIPFNEIHNSQVALEHEAKVSKISEEQLYYTSWVMDCQNLRQQKWLSWDL